MLQRILEDFSKKFQNKSKEQLILHDTKAQKNQLLVYQMLESKGRLRKLPSGHGASSYSNVKIA
jgi:hypothetical protein